MATVLPFRDKKAEADAAFERICATSIYPKRAWRPTRDCACKGYECRWHDPAERPWCPSIPDRSNPPAHTITLWSHL